MAHDPYKYFRIEARELLEQLGGSVLELEKSPSAAPLVAQALRLAHTLKGAARVVKQREAGDLAHAIEDALEPFREEQAVPSECVDRVLKCIDDIAAHVDALAPEGGSSPAAEEPGRTLRADLGDVERLLDGVGQASVLLGEITGDVVALERVQDLAHRLRGPASASQTLKRSKLDAEKTEILLDELEGLLARLRRNLSLAVERTDRELRQLRESAEALRLVPAERMFHVLERTLRDAAATLGRRVSFAAKGGDVRLGADVLASVQVALVQAVRNAVAHGIEPEAERLAEGKPVEGRVTIEVTSLGNRVEFRCRDDGRGLDLQSLRRAAQRKGVDTRDAPDLDAEALVRLLLQGGISTSRTLTEISGRGVGLDVVRDAAQRLGGQVSVRTQHRQGTTLELGVPISLSSLAALVVEAAGQSVAIPLTAIRRTLRVAQGDVAHSPEQDTIVFEGQVIPFAPLGRILRASSRPGTGGTRCAVVVEAASSLAALGVDRLRGVENTVLRPLPSGTPADAIVAGASLDAEGNPRIVLDPSSLVRAALCGGGAAEAWALPSRPAVLVIDDSMTTRMLERSILEAGGYEVDLAASAEEALEMAHARGYSLFLVDVEMPGMDGFSFIERARADPTLCEVPSILVTSLDSSEHRRRGEEVGARAYIVKSEFDQADLLGQIRKLVG